MSPAVNDILSKMQNIFLKSEHLVGVVIVCAPGFVAAILPVYDLSSCCYLRSVVLVVNGLASRLSQMPSDWSTVT